MPVSDRIKKHIKYSADSGIFTFLKNGKSAGTIKSDGYVSIYFEGREYKAHRLAWFFVYGEMPNGQIDHINHIKTDNKVSNLRVVSHIENGRNQKKKSTNKSGVNGVYWNKSRKKWVARITVKGREIHLGCFGDLKKATAKREMANIMYGFHKNHGEALCQ